MIIIPVRDGIVMAADTRGIRTNGMALEGVEKLIQVGEMGCIGVAATEEPRFYDPGTDWANPDLIGAELVATFDSFVFAKEFLVAMEDCLVDDDVTRLTNHLVCRLNEFVGDDPSFYEKYDGSWIFQMIVGYADPTSGQRLMWLIAVGSMDKAIHGEVWPYGPFEDSSPNIIYLFGERDWVTDNVLTPDSPGYKFLNDYWLLPPTDEVAVADIAPEIAVNAAIDLIRASEAAIASGVSCGSLIGGHITTLLLRHSCPAPSV